VGSSAADVDFDLAGAEESDAWVWDCGPTLRVRSVRGDIVERDPDVVVCLAGGATRDRREEEGVGEGAVHPGAGRYPGEG